MGLLYLTYYIHFLSRALSNSCPKLSQSLPGRRLRSISRQSRLRSGIFFFFFWLEHSLLFNT